MAERVDASKIEDIIGVERHHRLHYARAVTAEKMIYILHSKICLENNPDLLDCPITHLLDKGGLEWLAELYPDMAVPVEYYRPTVD